MTGLAMVNAMGDNTGGNETPNRPVLDLSPNVTTGLDGTGEGILMEQKAERFGADGDSSDSSKADN